MRTKTDLKSYLVMSVFLLGMVCTTLAGQTITVDDDGPAYFNNIQAAINAATHGDTVIVADGTYKGLGNRDIDFLGKAITVRSLNGPETCIINCEGTESDSHRGFYFHSGEGPDSVLSGLTITNGYAPKEQIGKYIRMHGGAIYCDYSSPVITNCIFRENISGWKGGAIMSRGSKPKIINCLFQNNVAQGGGGLHTSAVYGSSQGPIMTNCTFVDNFANNRFGGGGVYCDSTGKTTLTNCILWGNTFQGGGGYIAQVKLPNPVISCCCIEGSVGSAPLLAPDGYHLSAGSPCINAGDPTGGYSRQTDIDGEPRVMGGRVDIGADEYKPGMLVGLEIVGPNEVAENFSASYKAVLHFDNNSTADVTGLVNWSVEPNTYASIDDYGVLTTKDIVEGQSATIRASYTEGVVTIEGQKAIHIFALVGLEIVGPNEVAENFSVGYKAVLHFDNNSTADVTGLVNWSVEPNTAANIDGNGVLRTKDIVTHQSATILASYTKGDVTVEAEKQINIFAICPSGSALEFDGVDDYVEVPHSDVFNSNEISIEGWLYSNILTAGSRGILSKAYATKPYIGIWTQSNLKLAFEWANSSTYEKLTSSTNLQTNKWYHFAIVFASNNNVKLFINGNLDNSKTMTIPYVATHNTNTLRIGRLHAGYPIFDGFIDEVAIYNRALSAEEIWANMHRRLAGDEPGLVGYWDFDEGEGQIVYDLSGNGNDGQLGSTPEADSSDPAWVESDAPVGICTPYQIATLAVDRALERKLAMLEGLLAALAEEWTAYEALEEWLVSGDYGDLNKGDIVTAKQKIHSATQHEEQSIDALEKSIEKLEDALSALGYEPEPPVLNQPPNVNITNPQDEAVFGSYQTIEIEANAWDVDGSVVKVEFFANGSKIGEDVDGSDGWKTNWYEHPASTYSLTAKATDNDGAAATSPAVGITVVELSPPGQASNPNPANGATGVDGNTNLSWTAGSNAVSHDVYFGTTSLPPFIHNQTATTFDPGTMLPNTTYYWRIDEVNAGGTTTGTVWSFTTGIGGWPPPM